MFSETTQCRLIVLVVSIPKYLSENIQMSYLSENIQMSLPKTPKAGPCAAFVSGRSELHPKAVPRKLEIPGFRKCFSHILQVSYFPEPKNIL